MHCFCVEIWRAMRGQAHAQPATRTAAITTTAQPATLAAAALAASLLATIAAMVTATTIAVSTTRVQPSVHLHGHQRDA